MNKMKCLIMALMLCVSLAIYTQAESGDYPDEEKEAGVTIVLTKFDVNDTSLELGWKIKNDTDHDVWICASLKPGDSPVFEWFLDRDGRTFLIRRRFNLTIEEGVIWEFPFYRSRYQRLRSGQEKAESLSIALPVRPRPVFEHLTANAEYAERLAIEIGLYDEDLPGLIFDIVELAEKLNCDISLQSSIIIDNPDGHTEQFFGGVRIARAFHSENSAAFRNSVLSGGDELSIPYLGKALSDEQILRIEVDGVSIPYKSNYPPLAGHEGKSTEYQQSRQMDSRKQDKTNREKG